MESHNVRNYEFVFHYSKIYENIDTLSLTMTWYAQCLVRQNMSGLKQPSSVSPLQVPVKSKHFRHVKLPSKINAMSGRKLLVNKLFIMLIQGSTFHYCKRHIYIQVGLKLKVHANIFQLKWKFLVHEHLNNLLHNNFWVAFCNCLL